MSKRKVLGLIPARGGSKRLPQKNIKNFCGLPMMAWTIMAAQKSEYIDKLIVSTDNCEIAEIAKKFGCDVPFIRPKELSTDCASSSDVVSHALQYFYDFTHVILLQPTSPLRQAKHINEAFGLIQFDKDVSCISVKNLQEDQHSKYLTDQNGLLRLRTNDEPIHNKRHKEIACAPNGAIYISPVEDFISEKTLYTKKIKPYFMSYEESIDVDTLNDFNLAEAYLNKKLNGC